MLLQFRLTCTEQVTLRHWNDNSPWREAEWIPLVIQMAARERGSHCQDSMGLFDNIWKHCSKDEDCAYTLKVPRNR